MINHALTCRNGAVPSGREDGVQCGGTVGHGAGSCQATGGGLHGSEDQGQDLLTFVWIKTLVPVPLHNKESFLFSDRRNF